MRYFPFTRQSGKVDSLLAADPRSNGINQIGHQPLIPLAIVCRTHGKRDGVMRKLDVEYVQCIVG
jgi:hypothetical protein